MLAEVTDEMRQARAEAIAGKLCASCASELHPQADRLHVLMKECYKDNAHVFRPIEGAPVEVGPPPYDPNRQPVLSNLTHLGNTPLTR